MLMHEIPEGADADIGGFTFIHPEGCMAMRVPSYVALLHEKDGTRTLSGPVVATRLDGVVCNCFLIHDAWYVHSVARDPRAA